MLSIQVNPLLKAWEIAFYYCLCCGNILKNSNLSLNMGKFTNKKKISEYSDTECKSSSKTDNSPASLCGPVACKKERGEKLSPSAKRDRWDLEDPNDRFSRSNLTSPLLPLPLPFVRRPRRLQPLPWWTDERKFNYRLFTAVAHSLRFGFERLSLPILRDLDGFNRFYWKRLDGSSHVIKCQNIGLSKIKASRQ